MPTRDWWRRSRKVFKVQYGSDARFITIGENVQRILRARANNNGYARRNEFLDAGFALILCE